MRIGAGRVIASVVYRYCWLLMSIVIGECFAHFCCLLMLFAANASATCVRGALASVVY